MHKDYHTTAAYSTILYDSSMTYDVQYILRRTHSPTPTWLLQAGGTAVRPATVVQYSTYV